MSKNKWSQPDPTEDITVQAPPIMTKLEYAMIQIAAQLRNSNMSLSAIPASALDLAKAVLAKASEAHDREVAQ